MPLFNIQGRFTPKKSAPRKAKIPISLENCPNRKLQLGLQIPEISVKLGGVVCTFDDGVWQNNISSGKKVANEIIKLRLANEKLVNENNVIRVRSEILIDMVASNNVQIQQMEAELKQLRGILSKSPVRFSE